MRSDCGLYDYHRPRRHCRRYPKATRATSPSAVGPVLRRSYPPAHFFRYTPASGRLDTRSLFCGIVADEEEAKATRRIIVNTDDMEERTVNLSSMPKDMANHLTKAQIRDLVAFLVDQK